MNATHLAPAPLPSEDLARDLERAGELHIIRPAGGPLIPIAAQYSQPFGGERNLLIASAHEREPVRLFDFTGEEMRFRGNPVVRGVSAMCTSASALFAADSYAGTIMSIRSDCTHMNWRYEQRYSSPDLNARPIIESMAYGVNYVFAYHAGLGAVQVFHEDEGVLKDIAGPRVVTPPFGKLKSLLISEHKHHVAMLGGYLLVAAFVDIDDEEFYRTDLKVISNALEVMTTSQLFSRSGAVNGMVADNRVGELLLAVGNNILVFDFATCRGHFTVPGCEYDSCQIFGLNFDEHSGDLLVTFGDLTMTGMSGVTTISPKARDQLMTPHEGKNTAERVAVRK